MLWFLVILILLLTDLPISVLSIRQKKANFYHAEYSQLFKILH